MEFYVIYDSLAHDVLATASNTMDAAIVRAFKRAVLCGFDITEMVYGPEHTVINYKYVNSNDEIHQGEMIIAMVESE